MANFTESATLQLIDKTSAPARQINTALREVFETAKKLFPTADKLQKTFSKPWKIDLKILNAPLVLRQLQEVTALQRRAGAYKPPVIKVNQAQAALQTVRLLRQELQRINQMPAVKLPRAGSGTAAGTAAVTGSQIGGEPALRRRLTDAGVTYIGMAATHNLIEAGLQGLKEENKQLAMAQDRMNQLQLPKSDQAYIYRQATALSRENQVLTRGDVAALLADAVPMAGDKESALFLVRQIIAQINRQVAGGVSREKAMESGILFSKGADAASILNDARGQLDAKRTEQFFRMLYANFTNAGPDFKVEQWRSLVLLLRSSRFALDDDAWFKAMMMAEDMRGSAGVGLHQAITNLRGTARNAPVLAREGLLVNPDPKHIFIDNRGAYRYNEKGKQVYLKGNEIKNTFSPVAEKLLYKNPFAFIDKYVIPLFAKQRRDPTNAADVKEIVSQLMTDRTAQEFAVSAILRKPEFDRQTKRAFGLDYSIDSVKALSDASPLLALAKAEAQFSSLLGGMANSLNFILIPALTRLADIFNILSNYIAPEGQAAPGRAGALAVAGIGSVWGGLKMVEKFTGFADLKISAVNLNTAAANLNMAAGKLGAGAAAVGAGGAAAGAAGVGIGLSGAAKKGGYWKTLLRGGRGLASRAAGAAGTAAIIYSISDVVNYLIEQANFSEKAKSFLQSARGLAAGTGMGATLGRIAGPYGTAIGAVLGAAAGWDSVPVKNNSPSAVIDAFARSHFISNDSRSQKLLDSLRAHPAQMVLSPDSRAAALEEQLKAGLAAGTPEQNAFLIKSFAETERDFALLPDSLQTILQNAKDDLPAGLLNAADEFGARAGRAMSENFSPALQDIPATLNQSLPDIGANINSNR